MPSSDAKPWTSIDSLPRSQVMGSILMPAARVVWDMEVRGIRLDPEAVKRHAERLPRELGEVEARILDHEAVAGALLRRANDADSRLGELVSQRAEVWKTNGRGKSELTPLVAKARLSAKAAANWSKVLSSPQQKAWLLYDALGLTRQYREREDGTKTISVDKKAIDALVGDRRTPVSLAPVLELFKRHEHLSQIFDTFIKPLCTFDSLGSVTSVKERMYSRLLLHRTGTGRLASGNEKDEKAGESDTNQQNQPKDIRDVYIPDEGYAFIQADWKRVEWLLTLVFADDRWGFLRAITPSDRDPEGEDQHKVLAAAVFGVDYRDVSDAQRRHAKRFTHGINYGMGPRKLALEAGITEKEAIEVIRAYKAAFPLVAAWRESVVDQAKRRGYLETPYGWRRWFFGVGQDTSITPKILSHLPQGTGADMCKIALVRAFAKGLTLLTATHDSLLAQVKCDMIQRGRTDMLGVMEAPFRLLRGQTFPADVKDGMNWATVS